jgi:hypothetical protein
VSLSGTLQGNGITATLQAALPGPSAPTLTAVGWPANVSGGATFAETPALEIAGATTAQTLRVSVALPSLNDSVDIYFISVDNGSTMGLYDFASFNAATGQATNNPCFVTFFCDYTGSEMPPRTITVTVTHLEQNAVVGSFTFTFNPDPA